jgi:polygalacturonase
MIFGSRKSGSGDISDIYFKNIRIEGPVWSLFRLETNGSGDLGSIYNIRFEDITVNGPIINKNRIRSSIGHKEGETSSSWIKDISFKNVLINGKPLTKEDIEIGDFQVEGIRIE